MSEQPRPMSAEEKAARVREIFDARKGVNQRPPRDRMIFQTDSKPEDLKDAYFDPARFWIENTHTLGNNGFVAVYRTYGPDEEMPRGISTSSGVEE